MPKIFRDFKVEYVYEIPPTGQDYVQLELEVVDGGMATQVRKSIPVANLTREVDPMVLKKALLEFANQIGGEPDGNS